MFTCSDAFAHFVLPLEVNEVSNDTLQLQPGDTLLVLAGEREFLTLKDFKGTKEQPIHILNSAGKVLIRSTNQLYYQQGINVKHCEHIRILGNGAAGVNYGFEVAQTLIGSGIDIRELSGAVEIAYTEVHHTHFAGIIAKDDPDCSGRFNRENFLMKPLYLHHNYIHHTGGEGLYLGSTAYEGVTTVCNEKKIVLKPHLIERIELAFNRFEFTGREAIQVFSALGKVWVHHNQIEQYAMNLEASHSNGITLGLGTYGEASHNRISSGYGHGLAVAGNSWQIHNNLIVDAGNLSSTDGKILACGMYIDEAHLEQGEGTVVANNTIVRSRHNGLRLVANGLKKGDDKWTLQLVNNLFASWGTGSLVYGSKDTVPVYLWKFSRALVRAQLNFKKLYMAGFVDVAMGNFSLSGTSKALNMGVPLGESINETDFEGRQRTIGAFVDVGAYEHPVVISNRKQGYLGSCKQVFYPEMASISGKEIEHEPGDTFCLARGNWSLLKISNFQGSDELPVVFTNYDGRLQFTNAHVGLQLEELRHVTFSRINADSAPWYFSKIRGDAVVLRSSESVYLSRLSVNEVNNYGIRISRSKQDSALGIQNSMKNFELSHSRFSGIEGWWSVYLQGTDDQLFQNINLHHNSFYNNGKGGAINVGQVRGKIEVWKNEFGNHANTILRFEHCESLNLFANKLSNCSTNALTLHGLEQVYVHNNVLESALGNLNSLLRVEMAAQPIDEFHLVNNTVILTESPFIQGEVLGDQQVYNNLLVLKGSSDVRPFLDIEVGANLILTEGWQREFVGFDSGDYRPMLGSRAHCLGSEISLDFMRLDFTLKSRFGKTTMGAFSLSSKSSTSLSFENTIVYPNPASHTLQVELDSEPVSPLPFEVLGTNGDLITKGVFSLCINEVQLYGLSHGQYYLILHHEQHNEVIHFAVVRN